MRRIQIALVVWLIFFLSLSLAAQQTAPSDAQALLLLQRSAAALGGGQTLTDVTLSGSARRIAGSDDDTGTGVFKGLAAGAGRMDLSLPSGQLGEVQNLTSTTPAGTWSGPDRISHLIAYHNPSFGACLVFPRLRDSRSRSKPTSRDAQSLLMDYLEEMTDDV